MPSSRKTIALKDLQGFKIIKKFQKLHKLARELVAVDGTLIRALPRMSWALWQDDSHRSAKLHLHYAFLRQAVIKASVTDANSCERVELAKHLE